MYHRTDAIRVSGLVTRDALCGVDLSVPTGHVTALLGPAGAGKSALVEILLGLTRPAAGDVSVLGRPPRAAVRSGRVGAMLQHGTLLEDCTVHETVTMIAALHRSARPVTEALTLAGVADLARRRCATLSAAQRQQVHYAAALAGCPDLLVLDEPTGSMSAAGRDAFWASLRPLVRRGTTVLLATRSLPVDSAVVDLLVALPSVATATASPQATVAS